MNHTPEPWEPWAIIEDGGEANVFHVRAGRRWIIAFRQNGEMMPEEQRANIRRIAACVNACAGIPTEALEGAHLVHISEDDDPLYELVRP